MHGRRWWMVGAVLLLVARAAAQPARGFVITGRVTDGAGSVVGGVAVTAVYRDGQEGRTFAPVDVGLVAESQADGRFSLTLPYAGEFYVVALPGPGRNSPNGYRATFHPNARTIAEAKPVIVAPNLPAVGDIVLLPAKLSVVSGVVLNSESKPAPSARVAVARGDGFFGLANLAFIARPDGTFRVTGVPPGTYFFAYRETAWPPPRDTIPKISQATVVVAGEDVRDVRVAPLQMVTGSGRVFIAAEDRKSFQPTSITVSAFPVPTDGNPGPQRPGIVRDDLTFEFRTWPMPSRVRVRVESAGWIVKAIRLNGVDITDKTIEFAQGKDVTGLEIEIARR